MNNVVMITSGSCTLPGSKSACPDWVNQDRHVVLPLDGGRTLVSVFDGHGPNGHNAAAKAREFFTMAAPLDHPRHRSDADPRKKQQSHAIHARSRRVL